MPRRPNRGQSYGRADFTSLVTGLLGGYGEAELNPAAGATTPGEVDFTYAGDSSKAISKYGSKMFKSSNRAGREANAELAVRESELNKQAALQKEEIQLRHNLEIKKAEFEQGLINDRELALEYERANNRLSEIREKAENDIKVNREQGATQVLTKEGYLPTDTNIAKDFVSRVHPSRLTEAENRAKIGATESGYVENLAQTPEYEELTKEEAKQKKLITQSENISKSRLGLNETSFPFPLSSGKGLTGGSTVEDVIYDTDVLGNKTFKGTAKRNTPPGVRALPGLGPNTNMVIGPDGEVIYKVPKVNSFTPGGSGLGRGTGVSGNWDGTSSPLSLDIPYNPITSPRVSPFSTDTQVPTTQSGVNPLSFQQSYIEPIKRLLKFLGSKSNSDPYNARILYGDR